MSLMFLRTSSLALGLLGLASLSGCGGKPAAAAPAPKSASAPAYLNAAYAPSSKQHPTIAALTEMGKTLFFDRTLSASGQLACASCHSPEHAFGPPNGKPVQFGGKDGKAAGMRAAPSLRYLQTVIPFTEHHHDNDGNDSEDAGPTGGLTWDGRARSKHEQASIPLLAPNEMANASAAEVVTKIKQGPSAQQFQKTFGNDVFQNTDSAFRAALMALEVYQEKPAEFYPYTSKYDAFLRGQVKLSKNEKHGLQLFNDEKKGNCASCHISNMSEDGAFPLFTDHGLIALGAPRNMKISANSDAKYFDLGLCGPFRTDLKDKKEYCGLFRTPSLRNVATRKTFFHNGEFTKLKDVLKFYVERDTNPEKWYPRGADGTVQKFDDLPKQYQTNVNMEAPFGKKPGEKPALNNKEMDDVIAFLKTLTDGYKL